MPDDTADSERSQLTAALQRVARADRVAQPFRAADTGPELEAREVMNLDLRAPYF